MHAFCRVLVATTVTMMISSAALAARDQHETPVAPAADSSTTAAPAPADATYTLRAGDLLHISVWKEDELDRQVLILPDGTLDFPLIGSMKAAGSTPAELKKQITDKLKTFVPGATVTVVVMETSGNSVSIIGQVQHPGDLVMNHEFSVMQALSQAGGPTPYADEDSIVILRKVDGKEISIPFDYSDVSRGRHLDTNITLKSGDVIVVPTASLF